MGCRRGSESGSGEGRMRGLGRKGRESGSGAAGRRGERQLSRRGGAGRKQGLFPFNPAGSRIHEAFSGTFPSVFGRGRLQARRHKARMLHRIREARRPEGRNRTCGGAVPVVRSRTRKTAWEEGRDVPGRIPGSGGGTCKRLTGAGRELGGTRRAGGKCGPAGLWGQGTGNRHLTVALPGRRPGRARGPRYCSGSGPRIPRKARLVRGRLRVCSGAGQADARCQVRGLRVGPKGRGAGTGGIPSVRRAGGSGPAADPRGS
jgi:hypothetical protein